MFKGHGSSENKEFSTVLEAFLNSSGKTQKYPKLPKISNNQVSETVATKIPPTKELSTKNSGRTSRPRSAKIDDKKSIAKLRDTSKNYIFMFIIIIIVFII